MDALAGPTDVIWDVTYACPLRCSHCYSESGRRAARQLGHGEMLEVADAIVSLGPRSVEFAGGEPLLVKGIHEVAERIARAGIEVNLYTSGWTFTREMAGEITRAFSRITVSVDGATAEVHDRVRGRAGSFGRAMDTLAVLDAVSRRRVASGAPTLEFGIDCAVIRSNLHQLEEFCSEIAPRFPGMSFLTFAAAVPSGLASRPGFGELELLINDQIRALTSPETERRLRAAAPASVSVRPSDNFVLMMHPMMVEDGSALPLMQIEPDGEVRAMPIYEGIVGNILKEDPALLWQRAVARWSDPFVVEALTPVRSMAQWAEATRRIDHHFGTDEVRARIDRRPAYTGPATPRNRGDGSVTLVSAG
ncbi:radical SAM protein [Sphaerisporangium viridialbum]|uniref:radical SAM protein n=1 Tax=Sphaerisporangium viridialbum TaxID=46189 RepID=UPI003C780226